MATGQYCALYARSLLGVDAPEIQVEVHVTNGLPGLTLVGLPEASVKESKDRVRSALQSSGFQLPPKRITINLAPADMPKHGSRYDLAIAIGILVATGQLQPVRSLADFEWLGELGLNGELRGVTGVLPAVIQATEQGRHLVLSEANAAEAALVSEADLLVAAHLLDVCRYLTDAEFSLPCPQPAVSKAAVYESDLSDIRGQFQAKRLLEVCASGGHSLLMIGPPGAGKSMLASRFLTLLPDLSLADAIEVAAIHSVAGKPLAAETFFRRHLIQPHHTATTASMVGGGSGAQTKPGAISLAHKSVLFLDELPEFNRTVLEALREPLETRKVEIARVNQQVTYPADVQLICAMNPTPSGFFADDPLGRCQDTPEQIAKYQRKISGPLLDRIDCHLEVPPIDFQALQAGRDAEAETSNQVRERVSLCRMHQYERQGCLNADLSPTELEKWVQPDAASQRILEKSVNQQGLSARGYHRILRVARTLADMKQQEQVMVAEVAEALSYRSLDKS